jgi:V/A-type H+-transporting ATPase subunit A
MLKVIDTFYEEALKCVKIGIPISVIRKESVIQDILKIKYDIPNDKLELLDVLTDRVIKTFNDLRQKYE